MTNVGCATYSVYGLTVEEATPLHELVRRGEVTLPMTRRLIGCFLTHDLLETWLRALRSQRLR